MTMEQYSRFIELIPDIERVLKSKKVDVPRPQFNGKATDRENSDEEEEGEDEHPASSSRNRDNSKKRNHEATSDEDSE